MFRSVLRLNTFWDVRSFWTKLSPIKNHSIYLQHPLNDPGTKSCNKALNDCRYCWQASGGSRRGARPPSPLFLDQTEAWGAEKNLLWSSPSPAYLRVWMTDPPPLWGGGVCIQANFPFLSLRIQPSLHPPHHRGETAMINVYCFFCRVWSDSMSILRVLAKAESRTFFRRG